MRYQLQHLDVGYQPQPYKHNLKLILELNLLLSKEADNFYILHIFSLIWSSFSFQVLMLKHFTSIGLSRKLTSHQTSNKINFIIMGCENEIGTLMCLSNSRSWIVNSSTMSSYWKNVSWLHANGVDLLKKIREIPHLLFL